MKGPMLGEHCHFIEDGEVYSGNIIQIENYINADEGWLVNVQSPEIGDSWMGYYHTFDTKEQALAYPGGSMQ